VMGLAAEMARQMGLLEEEVRVVGDAALLHHIGKVCARDPVLKKLGPLDEKEWELMREYLEVGARIIASVEGLAYLAPVVRATHERWDEEGYPDGLGGEEILLAGRIIHACGAWHAITSDRPHCEALGVGSWIREFEENVSKQFDPRVVLALVEVLIEDLLPAARHSNLRSARPST
jgi:two-component system, cell cycle response regulator